MSKIDLFLKRAFDIIVSFCGIVVLWVPFLLVALLVKLTSQGPIFFIQKRVGRHGDIFSVVKFRTMSINTEHQGTITTANDTRITPIGTFLRKFKLDEFPQLWNVLIGKMSFVGPRPDVPGYADKLTKTDRVILELRPGITGPASLFFRNEEELLANAKNPKEYNDTIIWPRKVQLNLNYYNYWNFWKDLGYIFITLIPILEKVLRRLGVELLK